MLVGEVIVGIIDSVGNENFSIFLGIVAFLEGHAPEWFLPGVININIWSIFIKITWNFVLEELGGEKATHK